MEFFNNPCSFLSSDDIYLTYWEKWFKNLLKVYKIQLSSCNSEENISTQIYYLHLFIKQKPIFFQEWHENKRIILSFPQSAMLLQC